MKTKITTSRNIETVIKNDCGQYTLSKDSRYPGLFKIARAGYGPDMTFSGKDIDIKELILALGQMEMDTVAKIEEAELNINDK